MAACTSCGAALPAADAQCRRCGAKAVPELELQVPVRPSTRTAAQKPKAPQEEISLELAVDPRALVAERSSGPPPSGPGGFPNVQAMPSGVIARGQQAALARPPTGTGLMPSPHPAPSPGLAPAPDPTPAGPAVGDLAFDARLLADYGDAPSGVLRAPFYAWRVLRRQRELKAALATRREEAARAENDLLDALVALAERVRPTAEKNAAYAVAIEELRRGEDLLRSRDQVLAAEQDAQTARLGAVDARLSKLEGELAEARADEAALAADLSTTQGALGREEAKLKRAEIELRAAQQRESAGGTN